jgi:PEP-CTERM motif
MKTIISSLILVASVSGQAIQFENIRYWVGSGANQAALVIDFNGGTAQGSFVWGYRFDGAKSGEEMIRDIAAHDPTLDVGIISYSFGGFLDVVAYTPVPLAITLIGQSVSNSSATKYWSYYNGMNGSNSNWSYSNLGMSGRTLSNGDVDGWSFTSDPNFGPGNAPTPPIPANPVPEPATLAGLGIALAYWKKKSA